MRLSRTLPACRRLLLAAAMLLPLPATAHRAWMLPSATVLSGENPWVTVDAAISNDLFYFEHMPMPLDGLLITAPDGSRAAAENQARGRYRSTFDFQLKQAGTYRVAVARLAGGLCTRGPGQCRGAARDLRPAAGRVLRHPRRADRPRAAADE
jgi:hypothetical protein